jgi:hypothetical protein
LQARGEIGGVAGDIVLDNLAADDHQPGGDPDPRVELLGVTQLRHPIDQRQPTARGALGVVLVRLRITEINQRRRPCSGRQTRQSSRQSLRRSGGRRR